MYDSIPAQTTSTYDKYFGNSLFTCLEVRLVESRGQVPLGHGHADRVGDALSEGSSGHLDSCGDEVLGVSRGHRVQLPEVLQVVHSNTKPMCIDDNYQQ